MMRLESTYVINELPTDLSKHKSEKIEQGYLVDGNDASRIRKKGNEFTITRKVSAIEGDFSYREYLILPISKEEYQKMTKIMTKKLEKIRYYYLQGGSGSELRIDVFQGKLKGLVLAELVFPDEIEKRDFPLPSWLGREITSEPWMSNQYLAEKKYADIEKIIKKLG